VFPKIRAVILKIPKGKVATYGQVAAAAGFPGAARQVVWALRSARALPWHRVLGSGGKICLPGESGFEQKMRLQGEGVAFRGERVRMDLHQHEFRKRGALSKKRSKKSTR
jgi:methylated-DNA-protein-cysteine methyltransferase-like protein